MRISLSSYSQRVSSPSFFLWALYVILSLQLFAFVDKYAVNFPYWDQWRLFSIFIHGGDWLDFFLYQHGPHRQGVSFVLTKLIYEATDWNIRVEGFFTAGVVSATAFILLTALRRINGRLNLLDAGILVLVLTPLFYENMVLVPNASHSIFPLFLLSIFLYVQTIASSSLRTLLTIATNFLLIFTGFGLLVGVAVILWQIYEVGCLGMQKDRKNFSLALVNALATLFFLALFFVSYVHNPDIGCYQFPHDKPEEYLLFVSYLLGFFGGIHASYAKGAAQIPSLVFGACQLLVLLSVYVFISAEAFRTRRAISLNLKLSWILMTSGLIFLSATAVGRVCSGAASWQAPRYFPLITPAYLALFLYLGAKLPARLPSLALYAFLALFVARTLVFSLPLSSSSYKYLQDVQTKKTKWMEVYRTTHSMAEADASAGMTLISEEHIDKAKEGLAYIDKNKLSFMSK